MSTFNLTGPWPVPGALATRSRCPHRAPLKDAGGAPRPQTPHPLKGVTEGQLLRYSSTRGGGLTGLSVSQTVMGALTGDDEVPGCLEKG